MRSVSVSVAPAATTTSDVACMRQPYSWAYTLTRPQPCQPHSAQGSTNESHADGTVGHCLSWSSAPQRQSDTNRQPGHSNLLLQTPSPHTLTKRTLALPCSTSLRPAPNVLRPRTAVREIVVVPAPLPFAHNQSSVANGQGQRAQPTTTKRGSQRRVYAQVLAPLSIEVLNEHVGSRREDALALRVKRCCAAAATATNQPTRNP